MCGVSRYLRARSLSAQLKAAVFLLILMLALTNAFFYAQATLMERERETLERDRAELAKVVSELEGGNEILTLRIEIYEKTGVYPVKINQTLFQDNKTRIYYFFYTNCYTCEEKLKLDFQQRLHKWVSNISGEAIKAEIYNTMNEGEDIAKKIFSAVGLPESEITSYILDRLIVLNNFEAFAFSLSVEDNSIKLALSYLIKGSIALVQDVNKQGNSAPNPNNETLDIPLPIVFVLGISQGFNACLIALTSFIVAVTLQLKRGFLRALKRVIAISLGIFYVYLLLGFLVVSSSHIIHYVSIFAIPMALVLIGIGILHIAEVTHDFFTGRWRKGEEARIPLFKTPQAVKNLIQKTAIQDSLYFDFGIGALFSLIKLPCIAPLFFTLIAAIPSQTSVALISIITLNLGTVLPILILGSLACVGFLKVSQLSEIRFKGRIVQRLIVGASLIVSAAFILYLQNP